MSTNSSSYTYTSSTTSSSSTSNGSQPHTQTTTARAAYSSDQGGRAERVTQETGQPTVVETTEFPRQVEQGNPQAQSRITDVSDEEQKQRDREYEERMEEEYAKREGGA